MYPEIKTIPRGKKLQPLREKIATLKGNKKNMKKLIFFTILFALITTTGWAKTKNIVWDAPTTEYGTSYGDGYFYLALDVTKVELKSDETVEERWKQLFPSYWRDEQGDWKIALLEDCAIYKYVAHYNLPEKQQTAIERHLNVHSFPTYKLFDKEGRLLDLEVDARDVKNIARLLDSLQ